MAEKMRRRRCWQVTRQVARLEPEVKELEDEELRECAFELRRRRRKGTELLDLAPEMFALVREASRRFIGIRQYDLQIAGGFALAQGYVMELDTGEGKTFITPLAACLFALDRSGIHVLTANDYLAGRDAEILRPVYEGLGFSLGVVLADTGVRERMRAYAADVTYTTVPQLGYDFLRQYFEQAPDALRQRDIWQFLRSEIAGTTRQKRCLRGRHFAVMDEADSVLIDYARSPLSISVQADIQREPQTYIVARQFAMDSMQEKTHYTIDRVKRQLELTEKGKRKSLDLRDEFGYMHLMDGEWEERVREALTVEHLYQKGEHYVIREDMAILVDQTSGRLLLGQRLGGETHQALEAKEGLPIRPRQTVAKKVTVQALIRPYEHLAGLTGTAWEAAGEFNTVYNMATVRFAPRLKCQREVRPDLFFADDDARWEAVVKDVAREHGKGRPVLVGTTSIEKSRHLSDLLDAADVPHVVLNAVDHANEAEVIADAGNLGAVTVATNMAGRGVEIKLGDGVVERGGMHVVGTERHIVARMDRQLSGRTARRGAPGTAQFFACLEDEVSNALSERRKRSMKSKIESKAGPASSAGLERQWRRAQGVFESRFAQIRRMLLVQDLAQEEADKILFGQQNL